MARNTPLQVYLVDFTHTGSIVASNFMPLGIGLLASYAAEHAHDEFTFELFKYQDDLSQRLNQHVPKIIGFTNYSWNSELAYAFAGQIKTDHPETVIIFGGPNYGLSNDELDEFWTEHPDIDFYIVQEGEVAFLNLLQLCQAHNCDVDAIKRSADVGGNCHYLHQRELVCTPTLPRLRDLDEIGSPYLKGMMDKFFDDILIPLIHTTRGCPFSCTFCTEGADYYRKVAQRYGLKEELEYIAQRTGKTNDLVLSDANFGMYKDDIQKAQIIAEVRDKYDWPTRLGTSTGKNNKEREPYRVCRRAFSLRGWSHVTTESVFPRSTRASGAAGPRARG